MAHKESSYQRFVGQQLRAGKTMKEAARAWKSSGRRNPETKAERSRAAKKGWKRKRRNPETKAERSRAAKKGWSRRARKNPIGDILIAGLGAASTFEGTRIAMHFVDKYVPETKVITPASGNTPAVVKPNMMNHIVSIGIPVAGAFILRNARSDFARGSAAGFIAAAVDRSLEMIPKVSGYLGDGGPVYLGDFGNGGGASPSELPPSGASDMYMGDAQAAVEGHSWEP